MADIDKLIAQYGGSIVPEQKPSPSNGLADLAAQFGGKLVSPDVPTTPGGYGVGTFAKDMGKLTAAGAVPGVLGAPEAVEAAAVQQSKSTFAAPSEVLSYLSSPDKLANKFVTSLGFKPIFGEESKGLVPEEFLKKQEMLLDEVRAKGKSKTLKDLSAYGQKLGQDIRETASPEIQLAMANFVPTGSLSDIANGRIENLSFGAKPTALGFAGQFANIFGSVAPGMIGTIVTKDPKYMQAFGFGQAGSEGVNNAREYIQSLDDNQLSNNSPYFQDLLRAGYDSKTARLMTEEKAVDTAATAQAIVGAVGGDFTAKLITGKFDKALLSSVKNRALNIAARTGKGVAIGGTEEGLQEMAEGIASDLGIDKTVVKEIGSDAFANFVLGAIGGGGVGGVKGLVTKDKTVIPKPTPDELFADLTGNQLPVTGVPPVATDAVRRPTVPPAPPAAPAAEVELAPVPSSVVAPVAAMVSTVGLDPATAQRVEGLKTELKMIDSRRTDPTRVPSDDDLEFYAEREAELAKEITNLVSPKAPEPPTPTVSTVEPLNVELKARAEMRLDQLAADAEQTGQMNIRELNKLARDLEVEPSKDPMKTMGSILNIINPREEPVSVAPVAEKVVTEPEVAPAVEEAPEEVAAEAPVAPKGVSPDRTSQTPKTYNFGSGNIDARVSMAMDEAKYKKIYGEDGGILSFSLEGPGVDSSTGFKSVAGITYQGKMTPERLEEMMVNIAANNSKPEVKKTQAEINKERQAAQREAAKAEKPVRKIVPQEFDADEIAFAGQILNRGNGLGYRDEAKPVLKKLEKAGLIVQRNGKVFVSKEAEEAGMRGGSFSPFSDSDDMRKLKAFLQPEKPKTVVEMPEKEAKPAIEVSANKIFTEDAATKARNRLRSKLGQLNSGIDPEFLIDGITLSGYHIEKGARTFAAYAKAMIADLGDKVKPYLKQWYNAVRDDPSAESLVDSMDDYDTVRNADLPDTTDGMMDLMDPEDKFDIAKLMSATMTGPNPNEYKTILEARAFISKLTGKKIEAGTAEAKEADETIETAVVLAARDIIDLNRKNGNDFRTYDDLVALYERQPNLSVRTSTSVKEQAYSTPAPLAYVASRLAGITQDTTVYEPTAGNGMLLIAANPKKVIANELNATRYEMLERVLPGAEVVNKNALSFDPQLSDVVIANPPFGSTPGKEYTFFNGAIKTREIDHAIAYTALGRMPVNGRAVLIVGGVLGDSADKRQEGYRSKSKREFYYNLYKDYNVVDHFTVAGDMYKKQGASYPVDVIVIDGKGQSERKLPAADLPKVISSYEQLKEKLNEPSLVSKGNVSPTRVDSGAVTEGRGEQQGLDRGTVGQGIKPSPTGEQPAGGGTTGVSGAGVTPSGRGEPTGNVPSEGQPRPENKPKLPEDQQPVPSEPKRIEPRGAASTEGNKPGTVGGTSQVSSKRVEPGLADRRGQEQETATQVAYPPHSKAAAVGTLAPNAMATAIDESLTYLEDQVGDIDQYVADKLDFEVEDLKTKFSAEQVDALALAISNAEQGKGFIIGDQTGVGKGRVVAGMIKYALLQGQIPIFMTQKPNLYSDMIRDLDDIGMTDVLNLDSDTPNILITQSDEKIPFALARKDKDGNPIEKKHVLKNPVSAAKHNDFMKQLVRDNDLGKFKVIFSAYDSMNTKNGKPTERAKMVEHFADNNYLILDESHAAGGSGGDPDANNRASFIRKLVNNSKGSFFSSATYAKRPDVMDLYSTTDMKLAVDNISELAEAIKRGGVPMQQAVANMLTKSGQYIRRERTFAGVSYETKESKVDKPTAENMATAMRSILNFSDKKKGAVKDLKKELDEMGAIGGERDAKTDVEQANFGSTMHNLIDQMLLSLKTAESVDFAIERLKAGEKVVLTVANTMGSFMDEYAEENGINKGDPIDLSFRDLFLKYLDKQRWITIKYPGGKKEKRRLTDEELGPDLVALYQSVQTFINNAGFGAAPVSPIDYMHNALKKAGYKTDEITGRNMSIDYSGDVPILRGRTSDIAQRVNAVDGFNNGDTDVIILNQAGSTGLSLHASTKFKNQQKRHMIIVQPEKNIDTHMQMLGRVHRTGQVDTPSYSQMMADIPAEMRPAAVLLKKMASLNANTTASRKSSVTAEGVVDFMNDYGGQVVQEYLKDNPEVYEATGKKIKLIDDSTEGTVEDITKFTGYIPILPLEEQEEVYKDLTERYNELLERENSMGTNKLEARAMDLDAITVSTEEITEQKEGTSEFAKPAVMEKVDVKRTVKPYSSEEVKEMAAKNLDGKTAATYAGDQVQELNARSKDIQDKKIEKATEDGADAIRLDTIRNQIGMQTSKIRTILQTYRIGNQISVTDPNGGFVYGVIVNIATPKASANATAPSNWKMQIALANGDAKSVTISFSQIDSTYNLKEESYDVNWFNPETQDVEYVKVIQIFDKGSTARREKRWMITGNLLAGFAKFPGQIVNYTKTDAEGNELPDGQGILLPRQFDFEKAKEEAPVKIKRAEDVVRFLKEVDYSSVGTQDKVLRIVNRNGLFSFVVPKSKRIGGTFFLDEGLMKALGTQFTQRGSDMIANTWDEGKALAAIDYVINNRQNPIIALNPLKKAREMFQPKVALEEFVGNITTKQIEGRRDEVRQENIQRLKNLTREIDKNVKLVEAGKVNVQVQRDLVYLREAKKSMQKVITRTKPSKVGAQWVRTKASADNAAGNLSDDAYKVVENLANKYPDLLDGLQLSVPEAKRPGVTGNFEPIDRLVTVYKGGSDQARTMRHEIAHSMEQMMTPDAQMAVVESWADALSKAIEKNTDKPSQDYFHAVLEFIEKPSIANQKKANDLMPDYSFYQYLNPSEYWAVNAEPLMKAQLGSGWSKFVKAMQKLLESIKSVLGFDNRYAVHKEFDRIMSGDQQRMTYKMLVEYVSDNSESLKFLNNVEDFDKQFAEDGFNDTPIKPSSTVKDTLLGGIKQSKQAYKNTIDAPALAYKAMSGKLLRGITYVRNKNVWFGAGLEMAEKFTQKAQGLAGKLRDGEGRAMASIAITNALHAGHIASEVIMRGALAFNGKTQMFQAIRRPFSMANVMLEKHNLMDRVGAQRAVNMVNMFFEAKRSASIMEEYKELEKEVARLDAERLAPGLSDEKLNDILNDLLDAKQSLRQLGIAKKKVRMTEAQIKSYGDLDKKNPELRKMLDNWTKVNENMIDMMLFGKIISKKRAERLKGIKDYVPWYRIQDDMEDVHDQTSMGGVRSNTNIAKEKKFKDTEVDMDIDDIVDNMLHNVMVITRNSMRNYAANRVADAYATRIKGKIAVYPKEGSTKDGSVRMNILRNGRRVIIEIKDPLIAEAVTGMEDIAMPAMEMLGTIANHLRRGITLWPEFQVKQLFMDAPTAALVSGVKNPTKLWGETFAAFARAAVSTDPVVDMLKSYGIGGYQSYNRTPEQEYKQQIGLLEKSKYDWVISKLDKIGDASDYAQRVAIYNRVLAETGDEMQALLQANNVIDFLKRGSGRTAQFLTRTVAFMNAYAQQIDVLAMTLMGSGYTGKDKAKALAQLGKTAAVFSFYVMLYSWAVGGHDDYEELDDQTKLRNIYIPKALTKEIGMSNGLLIPMHTSASFFFKSIPEMLYNKVMKDGTVNEIDNTRLRHALAEAAMDSLLGPNPVPTGAKPLIEIGLNRSFFTGRAITPKNLEGLDAAEQYNASTSELGKVLSALTGNPFNESRVLNPIEADHLVRSLFGTTGAAVQWGTNLFSNERPTPRARDNPLFGSFISPDVGRAPEDLFYSFKDQVDSKYKTYTKLLEEAKFEQADKYFDRYTKEIDAHDYIASMDSSLAEINREIRSLGRTSQGMTPDQRRAEITELQRLKNKILDEVIIMRKEAGL
jgi:hypothetical protein